LLPKALPIGFGLVAVTAASAVLARRSLAPPSIFLVLVGLGLGFVPGVPRLLWRPAGRPPPPWRHVFVVGFTGMRGVVSLAAALSIPLMVDGAPFPDRGMLLLVTFAVILVTLVGQGLTFEWLIKILGLVDVGQHEAADAKRQEVGARIASIDAALAQLESLEGAGASPAAVEAIKRRHGDRRAYFVAA